VSTARRVDRDSAAERSALEHPGAGGCGDVSKRWVRVTMMRAQVTRLDYHAYGPSGLYRKVPRFWMRRCGRFRTSRCALVPRVGAPRYRRQFGGLGRVRADHRDAAFAASYGIHNE